MAEQTARRYVLAQGIVIDEPVLEAVLGLFVAVPALLKAVANCVQDGNLPITRFTTANFEMMLEYGVVDVDGFVTDLWRGAFPLLYKVEGSELVRQPLPA